MKITYLVLLDTLQRYADIKSEHFGFGFGFVLFQKSQQHVFIIRGEYQETVFSFTCIVFLYQT